MTTKKTHFLKIIGNFYNSVGMYLYDTNTRDTFYLAAQKSNGGKEIKGKFINFHELTEIQDAHDSYDDYAQVKKCEQILSI